MIAEVAGSTRSAHVHSDVAVVMRDGAVLRADVYLPPVDRPVPAILSRTPYDRRFGLTPAAAVDPDRATEAGFAMVCQDVRGQHSSEGEFNPFRTEGPDGHDTVEWIAAQPWCDGQVAMSGRSYAGATQWLAAAERPAHLKAIAPVVTGSDYFHGWVYQGGAFQLGFNLFWVHMMGGRKRKDSLTLQFAHLPLTEPPLLDTSEAGRFYQEWLSHSTDDEYWQSLAINRRYGQIDVPAFNVGGWYDIFLSGTLENFVGARREGGSEAARRGTRLVVGPWAHGSTYGQYPDHSFDQFAGEDRIDLDEEQLRFFSAQLGLRDHDPDADPPVRLFVMGLNRWREEDDWPLARARETPWYLHSGGDAAHEGGELSPQPPGEEPHDSYVYDPADAAPTLGGPTSLPGRFLQTNAGPQDQRDVEGRADVLTYTSDVLEQPFEVTGPLSVVLWAATSARDTDFVVKLCDVEPDGTSRILAEGILRARFREGYDRPQLVTSGDVYEYRIDVVATSNVFLAGHRIRVVLTSSSFPRFDRNANTGRVLGADGPGDLVTARQTIFHDAERPSHVVLPVVST
jgi:putative CocE/NonD family hydrolase